MPVTRRVPKEKADRENVAAEVAAVRVAAAYARTPEKVFLCFTQLHAFDNFHAGLHVVRHFKLVHLFLTVKRIQAEVKSNTDQT